MIVFDRVSFSYANREILRDMTFSINADERVAILGGSDRSISGRPAALGGGVPGGPVRVRSEFDRCDRFVVDVSEG